MLLIWLFFSSHSCIIFWFHFLSFYICDNSKYRLAGYQAIKDTAIKQVHYLTVSERYFSKEQENNEFLNPYKNYAEARAEILEQARKQKAEYHAFIKAKFSADNTISYKLQNNSLNDKYII